MRQAVFVLSIVLFVAVTAAALQHQPGSAIAATDKMTPPPDSQTAAPRSSC